MLWFDLRIGKASVKWETSQRTCAKSEALRPEHIQVQHLVAPGSL